MDVMEIRDQYEGFFQNKKVLVTGHTGFKGSWLCILLNELGADVYGYALMPPTNPSLYNEAQIDKIVNSTIGDIRDFDLLTTTIKRIKPEIVFHMAAQPLVRYSYQNPRETYEVNVMGTVNLLEAIRLTGGVKAVVNITTDKCYENKEWHWGYRENEPMGGYDPYSNSKGCSELVTSAYRSSFFNSNDFGKHGVALASARAGNVIGGGDWADDRLIPDFIRSISKGKKVKIRSPYAIRPWQHVLEPLSGYLLLSKKLYEEGINFTGAWNFGPDDNDAKNVEYVVQTFCSYWGKEAEYELDTDHQPHEAHYLKLDCSKVKAELSWTPKWDIETSILKIVDWTKNYNKGNDVKKHCIEQIKTYFSK